MGRKKKVERVWLETAALYELIQKLYILDKDKENEDKVKFNR